MYLILLLVALYCHYNDGTQIWKPDSCLEEPPELVKEGKRCDEEDGPLCEPTFKKQTRTGDYGIKVTIIAQLVCVDSKCVMDNSIDDGDDCEIDRSCQSGRCGTAKTCLAPREKPDTEGVPCDLSCDNCFLGCMGDLVCHDGACVSPTFKAEGQSCSDAPTAWCDVASGLWCSEGICTQLVAENDTCTTPGTRLGCIHPLICNGAAVCSRTVGDGEPCDGSYVEAATSEQLCDIGLLCAEGRCRTVSETPSRPASPTTTTTTSSTSGCTVNRRAKCSGTQSGCSCGALTSSALVCNNDEYIRIHSIPHSANASTPLACHPETWFDRRKGICVQQLACSTGSDCLSPVGGVAYCDCSDSDEPTCKYVSTKHTPNCDPEDVQEDADDLCESSGTYNRRPVLTNRLSFPEYQDAVENAASVEAAVLANQAACFGENFNIKLKRDASAIRTTYVMLTLMSVVGSVIMAWH